MQMGRRPPPHDRANAGEAMPPKINSARSTCAASPHPRLYSERLPHPLTLALRRARLSPHESHLLSRNHIVLVLLGRANMGGTEETLCWPRGICLEDRADECERLPRFTRAM